MAGFASQNQKSKSSINIKLVVGIALGKRSCWRRKAANKFSQAIDLYTKAIELNGANAVYWANRAFANAKLEEYGSALQDASKAVEIDPKYSKGYYRRGAAYLAMGKFKEALKDFQQVKRLCPNDPDASKKLKECEKAVMKLKFEEAISAPTIKQRPVSESIDLQTIGFHQCTVSVSGFLQGFHQCSVSVSGFLQGYCYLSSPKGPKASLCLQDLQRLLKLCSRYTLHNHDRE